MTDKEYCNKINELWDKEKFEELYELQRNYMKSIVEEFKQKATEIEDKIAYDLIEYACSKSYSGNAIIYLSNYNLTENEKKVVIDNIKDGAIWERLGDYLLDEENYEENDDFVIDVMFAGNYVPEWDGFEER